MSDEAELDRVMKLVGAVPVGEVFAEVGDLQYLGLRSE